MTLRRPLLFAAAFFMMFGLGLLIGGDRILVTDQEEPTAYAEEAEPRFSALFTFFCGVMEPHRVREMPPPTETQQNAGQCVAQAVQSTIGMRRADAWPTRDANGNVLQQGRYIQAVYAAFSPEDTGG